MTEPIVEFKAGRCDKEGNKITPIEEKGLVKLKQVKRPFFFFVS